jgi:hypothetical protein
MLSEAVKAQYDKAYQICVLQASVDGAFDELLLRHWFEAAWMHCAEMVGLVYPAQQIKEPIIIDDFGNFRLSYEPSSEVRIYDGYTLVMVLPPSLLRSRCDPALCCFCNLTAQYTVGQDVCELPPSFVQAVARLFTYMVENRGDVEMDENVLSKCGALAFLSGQLTYVL